MIVQHEVLEHGDFAQRQQVVRWIRKFPFSFISGELGLRDLQQRAEKGHTLGDDNTF